jgi:hypothetical protein
MLLVAALIAFGVMRSRGALSRSLDMQLMLFLLPRYAVQQAGNQDDKKLISLMEQLYATVATFHVKGWNKFLYGDPHLALEMAVPHVGELIHFYAAVPSKYADQFEKQVHGVFPMATVERIEDYNIFNPTGASAGGYLKLKEESVLPFQTYTSMPTDPLGPIVGAMAKLTTEGEGAAVQVIVRPSSRQSLRKLASDVARQMQLGNPFRKAMQLAKHPPKAPKDGSALEPQKVATEFESAVIKGLQAKASRPLFDCNVRIVTSAPTQEQADAIFQDIAGAFAQYSAPDMNALKVEKLKNRALERHVYDYAFRLYNDAQALPLSSEEVTSVYHFPNSTALLSKVKFANFRTSEPPTGIPDEGTPIGYNIFHGKRTELRLSKEDRRRHMYIIGQTGTGKSTTMKAMIIDDMKKGEGVTVMDPHGELAEWTLPNVPKERVDDVIYFNPTDTDFPMGLNMLEYDPAYPQEKSLIIDELLEIMEKLYGTELIQQPQFQRYFKNALFLLMDNYERRVPVLADVSRVFVDEEFRKDLLAHEPNQMVKQFWELEATKTTGEQSLANFTGYITSKIDQFTNNDFLRPIINQPKSVIDFRDVIENKKILLVNLSKGKIGDMNSSLLGMVILGKLRRTAMARDTKREDLPDHYIYMDEFQNFTTQSISVVLSEARKYRLCMTMAHQFLKQLDEKIAAAVFGNVGTIVSCRISPEDAEDPRIKTKFEPVFTPYDLSNIDNYNAYISMLVQSQVGRPTNMRIYFEAKKWKGIPKVGEAIVEINRLRYGRPKAQVEAEIQQRFGLMRAPSTT